MESPRPEPLGGEACGGVDVKMLGGQRLRRPAPGSRGWICLGQSPWEVWGVRRMEVVEDGVAEARAPGVCGVQGVWRCGCKDVGRAALEASCS
eukprot:362196-Chlamydomonas_euryale.AAC.1